jgi:hypothetical protein
MNRTEAITVIKQIYDICPSFEGKSIKLLPPEVNSSLQDTFRVYIQTDGIDEEAVRSCILAIAKAQKLKVEFNRGSLIISKHHSNQKNV